MYCRVENQILGSNESYNLIKMCMCVCMVDGGCTPFGKIFPSLLFDNFETWAMFLYSPFLMHALEHVLSSSSFFT
jgi:hypothetical protein